MSNFKGHLVGGLVAYISAIFLLSLGHIALVHHVQWLVATLAGALFPDIDIRSKGQRLFLQILALLLIGCLFLQAYIPVIFILICGLLPLVVRHRGLFHDIGFIIALTGLVSLFFVMILPERSSTVLSTAFFFLLGTFSHLVLDKGLKKAVYK